MSNINNYGFTDFYEKQVEEFGLEYGELITARVIEVQKEKYRIVNEIGEKWAILKGSVFYNDTINSVYPAVGDFVLVKQNPYGDDIIYKVFERKTKFSRLDSHYGKEQIVAANFDYIFIMTSLNHDFNVKRLERYLTSAWQSGGIPVIILTKMDLVEDVSSEREELDNIAFGVDIIGVSSFTGEGIEDLKKYIQPTKTIVFLGSSGVGKSSLVNAIAEEEIMTVNDIRDDDSKGRHTTTHRQLIMLENGTMIIDTPGMRELGMWGISDGLDSAFSEIEEISVKCKFKDCNHKNEPGCAIKEALKNGELSRERWDNYIKLKKEARYAEKKESINAMLKEKAHHKKISKFQKEFYKK